MGAAQEERADGGVTPLAALIGFDGRLEIADVGAAWLGAAPSYRRLLELELARLNAFEPDDRQHARLREVYGQTIRLHPHVLGDGGPGVLHVAEAASGMTSLLSPSPRHLAFFNAFPEFGRVSDRIPVQTTRLDDVADLPDIDFLKMDIQGGELAVLMGAPRQLARCAVVQLEVSFVPLYEGQPTFGEIDVWMRAQGFLPHSFAELKRWSIAPVLRNNNPRAPFNQLLEADVVYVRDPVTPERWDADLLRRLVLIAHYAYGSVDLAGRLIAYLQHLGAVAEGAFDRYIAFLNTPEGRA